MSFQKYRKKIEFAEGIKTRDPVFITFGELLGFLEIEPLARDLWRAVAPKQINFLRAPNARTRAVEYPGYLGF